MKAEIPLEQKGGFRLGLESQLSQIQLEKYQQQTEVKSIGCMTNSLSKREHSLPASSAQQSTPSVLSVGELMRQLL